MNHMRLIFVIICTIIYGWAFNCFAKIETEDVLRAKINGAGVDTKKASNRRRNLAKTVSFYFDNEDLIDIINFLASLKEVNIVLPMGANAINTKVTLHLEEKITIDEAWNILYTLLDIAGYSMISKENTYNIVRTTNAVSREALPLYIVKPSELPDNDKRIRYLYYFSNIKIPDNPNNDTSEIFALVKEVLPENFSSYRLDSQTNSLLLSDKASDIKALMQIITALDQTEEQEKPEIIQLRYLPADAVANLFNEHILKAAGDANQQRLGIRQTNNSTYFKKVRIIPDLRTNRLIVFGRPQSIERVRDFIHKYIDVETESGKSILHVYQLQYLDAHKFKDVLARIVKSERIGGTEQSKTGATQGGTERFFNDVIIYADQPETISGEQTGSETRGNNNLIIAARNDDYERIKKLIEELDIPQPQVIIEVLIADLTIQDIASLGASIRNPLGVLPDKVNFQSAQATDFLTNSVNNPSTIQADLLRRGFNQSGSLTSSCDTPSIGDDCFSSAKFITNGTAQGTALVSLNDAATGQTWGIGQVRKFLDGKKVLSHPHLITTNNQKAEIKIEEQRLALDQGSGATGGTTTQTRKWLPAALSVTITPRISSSDMVNLRVVVNINQFESSASSFTNTGPNAANTGNQISRNVTTNANVRSGNILALGGLTRVDTTVEQLETPLLGKIPIIGWFFKDRTNTTNKNNLTVFISPTIIMPRLRGGVGTYTKNHVQLAKSYSREGMLFDNLRDPITRWFFRTQREDAQVELDNFIAQDELIAPTIFDNKKETNRSIANNNVAAKPSNPTIVAQSKVPPAQKEKAVRKILADEDRDLKTIIADADNPFTTQV